MASLTDGQPPLTVWITSRVRDDGGDGDADASGQAGKAKQRLKHFLVYVCALPSMLVGRLAYSLFSPSLVD